jgi:hypothetical protein
MALLRLAAIITELLILLVQLGWTRTTDLLIRSQRLAGGIAPISRMQILLSPPERESKPVIEFEGPVATPSWLAFDP